MVLALSLGFFEVSGFGGYRFVGLANYRRMLADPLFLQSLRVTLTYVVAARARALCPGLGLALLVQRDSPLQRLFRSLFFMPQMVSLVVVALVWQVLLVDKIGIINRFAARARRSAAISGSATRTWRCSRSSRSASGS